MAERSRINPEALQAVYDDPEKRRLLARMIANFSKIQDTSRIAAVDMTVFRELFIVIGNDGKRYDWRDGYECEGVYRNAYRDATAVDGPILIHFPRLMTEADFERHMAKPINKGRNVNTLWDRKKSENRTS